MRGTFDATARYRTLDIVQFDKSSFIARHDDPGLPGNGDGWQLAAAAARGEKGVPGPRGGKGEKGEKGDPAPKIVGWQIDRENYVAAPVLLDGKHGAPLELRGLFEQYHEEAGG